MTKKINSTILTATLFILAGCGFHLRGVDGSYQFPYKKIYLQCETALICPGLKSTITKENLATLVTNRESAEVTIAVGNEQTARDPYGFNSVGQIASYLLTYQITAKVLDRKGEQIGNDIVVENQMTMAFNNSLILSAQQQEDTTWSQIHDNVINSLIRRIVYSHPKLVSSNVPESK